MSEENVRIVRDLYEHWAQGDFATGTVDAIDPQVEYERIGAEGAGGAGSWHGIAGLGAAVAEYISALQDLRIEGERFVDVGEGRVLVACRHRAVGRASGLPYEKEIADIFTLRDGRIVRWETYWNPEEALEAAGLSE